MGRTWPTLEAHSGRVAGWCGLAAVVLQVAPNLALGRPPDAHSAADLSVYLQLQSDALRLGISLDALGHLSFLVMVLWLARSVPAGGVLATLAVACFAIVAGLDLVAVAAVYGAVDLARTGSAADGAVALFAFSRAFTAASFAVPGAVGAGALGLVCLRTQALPAILAWWLVLIAAVTVVSVPLRVSTPLGSVLSLVVFVLLLVWTVASSVYLLRSGKWAPAPPSGDALGASPAARG